MQIQTEFSKMQCLLTGNRFSGVNLHKTRYDFDAEPINDYSSLNLTIVLTIEVDYIEKEDAVKYIQSATINLAKDYLVAANNLELIKDIVSEIIKELVRRYETSQVFKFLELKEGADELSDLQLTERLTRVISDYNNRV